MKETVSKCVEPKLTSLAAVSLLTQGIVLFVFAVHKYNIIIVFMVTLTISKSHFSVIEHTQCVVQPPLPIFRTLSSSPADILHIFNYNLFPHYPLAATILLSVSVDSTVHDASNKLSHSGRIISSRPIMLDMSKFDFFLSLNNFQWIISFYRLSIHPFTDTWKIGQVL